MKAAKLLNRTFGALNRSVYRATGGKVAGHIGKAPILLLTTTGRKTGKQRTMPLLYLRDGGNLVVVASSGGSAESPGWFHNLKANPAVEVQTGRERRPMRVREATREEHDRLWPRFVEIYAGYDKYQRKTTRKIPIVVLEPET